jgi:hypothetical protein
MGNMAIAVPPDPLSPPSSSNDFSPSDPFGMVYGDDRAHQERKMVEQLPGSTL